MIYLDYNATAPVRAEVIRAMCDSLKQVGNPSSVHGPGREARGRVELARMQVAALVGARPRDVIFTSGGSEANNLALKGCGRKRLAISACEHASVTDVARAGGAGFLTLPVTAAGTLDMTALEAALAGGGDGLLVSVMLANNETGVIQPITDIAEIVHAKGALLHVDAVQALGKIPVDFTSLKADMLSLSAHKIGGPQGVGALVLSPGLPLTPEIRGGGQELSRRSGTENVAGIVGFGVAAQLGAGDLAAAANIAALRDLMEKRLLAQAPGAVIAGGGAPRIGNTSTIVMPGVAAETQIMHFDLAGICVSAGAACSSGKVKPSQVLLAMGFDETTARSAIRVSLGRETGRADIDAFITGWLALYQRTRRQNDAAAPGAVLHA